MAFSRLSPTKFSISFSSILILNALASLSSFMPLTPCLSGGCDKRRIVHERYLLSELYLNNTMSARSYKGALCGKDDAFDFEVSLGAEPEDHVWRILAYEKVRATILVLVKR